MYHVNENNSLNTITVAIHDGEKNRYLKVKPSDIELKPLGFMDILPPRVKIAKLYDKDYNLQSLNIHDDPIRIEGDESHRKSQSKLKKKDGLRLDL